MGNRTTGPGTAVKGVGGFEGMVGGSGAEGLGCWSLGGNGGLGPLLRGSENEGPGGRVYEP